MGKAYCVGAARTRCVACHDGNATTLDKTSAHAGMDAHPLRNNDNSRCQSCHEENTPAYVNKFIQIAGVRQIHYVTEAEYHFTPQTVSTGFSAIAEEKENPSWLFIVLFGLVALLHFVGFFLASRYIHQ
jgi:hypothetical protein